MAPFLFSPKTSILNKSSFLLLVLFLSIDISHGLKYPSQDKQVCAVLHSERQLIGEQYTLFDFDQSVNLKEDYRASDTGWSATRSVNVTSNCNLKICNETYLDEVSGLCRVLNGGEYQAVDFHVTDIASVDCTCRKECKCSDIFMKKSTCARGYLKGGCKTCNSMYTEFVGKSFYVPDEFYGKIEALRIRKGCQLITYPEEEFEGEKVIYDEPTVENYIEPFYSFECNCNDDVYEPKAKLPRPASFPALIEIPSKLDEIVAMLAEKRYSNHPGLKSALSSNIGKRGSQNAYILLLGATGAGKSSAMPILFDNPNVTKTGLHYSTNSAIHEFRIPVPIDELGIANSELRIIDTPGLGDTRGLEQDARFLATLENFLSTHEELYERIPNVVLIFHKFNDIFNRINGEGSFFIRMLRVLDRFRSRITDENYSNVVFVLSHFCSETRDTTRRPDRRLFAFKELIENYSLFPKPILISVAENKARDNELPMVNGFFKLPNNEYYPRNLFEKLELVTEKGRDLIGLGVFKTAFRHSEDFNITSSTFNLVSKRSNQVQKYLSILIDALSSVERTDVSQHLQEAWETQIDISLKNQFPHTLSLLQKALYLRNVNTKEDIPKTSKDVISLLTKIKPDNATKILLEKGLGVKPPTFPHNTIAGFSYNVFKDTHLPTSLFSMGDLELSSDTGFMLPKILTCNPGASRVEHLQILENQQDYIHQRLRSLGIFNLQIDDRNFKGNVKPGYNIKGISLRNDGWDLSAILEIRLFQLRLATLDFTPAFKTAVLNLPALSQSDPENLLKWNDFFNEYGTHVVRSVYGGGSIEIQLRSGQPLNETEAESIFDLIKFAEDLLSLVDGKGNWTKSALHETKHITHSLKFTGGDIKYHTNDLTKMSLAEASELLANWKNSLKFYPSVLTTDVRLIPISQIVRRLGRNYSVEIGRVAGLKLSSSLTYVPQGKQHCPE